MMTLLVWGSAAVVTLLLLDRLLLWAESRGWIFYRRTRAGRGAATYHLLEWNAILDPSMKQAQEILVEEEEQEDESGAPPGPDPGDGARLDGGQETGRSD